MSITTAIAITSIAPGSVVTFADRSGATAIREDARITGVAVEHRDTVEGPRLMVRKNDSSLVISVSASLLINVAPPKVCQEGRVYCGCC